MTSRERPRVYAFDEASRFLARTPAVLASLLRGAPPTLLDGNEGVGTWSPRQVVAHLLDAERRLWLPRIRVIMNQRGETFEPFDRFGHLEAYAGAELDHVLDAFASERTKSLASLKTLALTPEELSLSAHHPELGRVTLGQLLSTWVTHDLSHITQVTRVMAKQYVHDVGPWVMYLSVFGHQGPLAN